MAILLEFRANKTSLRIVKTNPFPSIFSDCKRLKNVEENKMNQNVA